MEICFVPEEFQKEDSNYEGFIKFPLLASTQKLKLLSKVRSKFSGEASTEAEKLEYMCELIMVIKDYYKQVEIKRKSDGKEYKSFDDLDNEPELSQVFFNSANFFMNSLNLGNVKGPLSSSKSE